MDTYWNMDTYWIFTIDTEQYAGNFERDMTAFITGQVGECGVGQNYAERFSNEVPSCHADKLCDAILYLPDDRGCCRPCAIQPTPGWFNTGSGGHFRNGQDAEALKAYKKAETANINRELARMATLTESPGNWTKEQIAGAVARLRERLTVVETTKTTGHYPAFLSVGIFFEERPDAKMIEFMQARARAFNAVHKEVALSKGWNEGEDIIITGFRLIRVETVKTEEKI